MRKILFLAAFFAAFSAASDDLCSGKGGMIAGEGKGKSRVEARNNAIRDISQQITNSVKIDADDAFIQRTVDGNLVDSSSYKEIVKTTSEFLAAGRLEQLNDSTFYVCRFDAAKPYLDSLNIYLRKLKSFTQQKADEDICDNTEEIYAKTLGWQGIVEGLRQSNPWQNEYKEAYGKIENECAKIARKRNVAVYMAGKEPAGTKGVHKIFGSELAKAIAKSGTYSAIDRTEAITKQISKERMDAINDEQIKKFGKQFNVQYFCIAEISEAKGGFYFLEARLVNVKSARVLKIVSAVDDLRNARKMENTAQRLARRLIEEQDEITKAAEEFYNRGNFYFNESDYDKAIAAFTEAIRLKPDVAEYYNDRGVMYSYKGDLDNAIADYTEAIRLEPNEELYRSNRGNSYFRKEDYDKAIADYTELIRLKPNDADYHKNRGNAYYHKKNYDKAIANYNEAIRLNPKNVFYRMQRAYTYFDFKKDFKKTIADCEAVLRIEPNNNEAKELLKKAREAEKNAPEQAKYHNERGEAFYKRDYEYYTKAIDEFTEAVLLMPKEAKYYYNRYLAYLGCFNFRCDVDPDDENGVSNALANAMDDLNEAIRLKPNVVEYRYARGELYSSAYFPVEYYGKAIADYTEAIRLAPNVAKYRIDRGHTYFLMGQENNHKNSYEKAVVDFEAALRIEPSNDEAKKLLREIREYLGSPLAKEDEEKASSYYEKGKDYSNKNDYDKAIVEYNEAIRLSPNNGSYRFSRGIAYHNKKDYDNAIASYTEAISLMLGSSGQGLGTSESYNKRGRAYIIIGDYDKAIADFTEAIKYCSSCAAYYSDRGNAYRDKKDYDKAITAYTEAIQLFEGGTYIGGVDKASCYKNRALAYYNKKEYNKAIADLEASLKIDPNNAWAKDLLEKARKNVNR
jgi:tetratricopeptide (TPR) repeat protein